MKKFERFCLKFTLNSTYKVEQKERQHFKKNVQNYGSHKMYLFIWHIRLTHQDFCKSKWHQVVCYKSKNNK